MTKIEDKAENYEWWICRDGNVGSKYWLYYSHHTPFWDDANKCWRIGYPNCWTHASMMPITQHGALAAGASLRPGGGPIKVKLVPDEET